MVGSEILLEFTKTGCWSPPNIFFEINIKKIQKNKSEIKEKKKKKEDTFHRYGVFKTVLHV